jgi:hypothetical protein
MKSALLQYWNFEPKKDEKEGKEEADPKNELEPAERVIKPEGSHTGSHPGAKDESQTPPPKKVPVFFLDEAHKLPALVPDEDAIKMFLDSVLYDVSILS